MFSKNENLLLTGVVPRLVSAYSMKVGIHQLTAPDTKAIQTNPKDDNTNVLLKIYIFQCFMDLFAQ